jgi:hypothetical protein
VRVAAYGMGLGSSVIGFAVPALNKPEILTWKSAG